MDYNIDGILGSSPAPKILINNCYMVSVIGKHKLCWSTVDDALWKVKAIERANRIWKAIPEEDLPRYAALGVEKGNRHHPIKYLIMLASRTYLERYDGRI